VVHVRLRKPNHDWLKVSSTEQDAVREMRIASTEWTQEESVLGPIRADQSCIVSLELGKASVGEKNSLFIRDLEIHELRPMK
jgi:hypothetical protein